MKTETFSFLLLEWCALNKRKLPWKETKDPYKIWISEIILQQTRVEQGTPYYLRFIQRFPDIGTLAAASEDEVIKLWEGLGYYTRARNIHATAKFLVSDFNSTFPENYEDILKLKGIGSYTAAAIASFAFGLSYPVLDGNVIRLVSRILGLTDIAGTKPSQKKIHDFVTGAIQNVNPAVFNQAIMDFGSGICQPKSPKCSICPFEEYCVAFQFDKIAEIPVKAKSKPKLVRYFHYLDMTLSENFTVLHQRPGNDIWKKLYELPMIETASEEPLSPTAVASKLKEIFPLLEHMPVNIEKRVTYAQVLTHRKIVGIFYKMTISDNGNKINKGHYLVERKKVSNFAFPKIITKYFTAVIY